MSELTKALLRAERQTGCFVCGQDNARGLQIFFEIGDDGVVTAEWIPSSDWEGFRGILHGGIISTVLDESMSKAVALTEGEALTGELRVRFRRHVSTGQRLHVRGWIVRRAKRLIETEATLTDTEGNEYAHAWARFLALPKVR